MGACREGRGMKTISPTTVRKFKLSPMLLAAGFLSCAAMAPQAVATEYSAAINEASTKAQATPEKAKENQSTPKSTGQQKPKTSTAKNADDDEEKSGTEKLQEGIETAQDAYEKVGSKIMSGDYAEALDGATDMAKDKLIETAEDALKKKNENLYKAYKLGKDIKDDVLKGDYAAVWKTTKDAAYDEAKEYVEDKIIEKAIPGYGQLKGAWDVGYEVIGPAIGKLPISADGRTVNNLAEDQMTTIFYSGKDSATSKKLADEEVIQAFIKSVRNGDVGLPEGLNFGETTAKIRFNLDYGFPPLDAIELSPGTKERELLAEQAAAHVVAAKVTPVTVPEPVPEPVEDDPWAVDPTPKQATPQAEAVKPQETPADDIWATDDDAGGDSLDEQRYRLQEQLEADKARDRAIAESQNYQKFSAAEAKREEDARVKAEKDRKFREGMNALAQGLGQVAQQIQQAPQGGIPQSNSPGSSSRNGKRAPTPAEKTAAIYQMCVQRTGDQKGCREMSSTGVKLDSDLNNGKIPMDFIKKICRDQSDSQKNYDRCVSDKVAEMKRRMGKQ